MDSTDLLAREEEFRKLNKQLEKKTVSLMKEIETTMQKQDFFSEFSPSLALNNHCNTRSHHCDSSKSNTPEQTPTKTRKPKSAAPKQKKGEPKKFSNLEHENADLDLKNGSKGKSDKSQVACKCCSSNNDYKNEDLEFLYAFVGVNVQSNVLPQSFLKDKVSVESICKFLASKVKLMQEQIDKVQAALNRKVSLCENHLTQVAEFEGDRLKLLNRINNLTAESSDMKAKAMTLQNKLNEKDRLYKEQRSESDKLSSEAKRLRSKNASMEARCVTQEEEIDRLKLQVQTLKTAEKDFRDSTRSLSSSQTNAISRLETKVKSLTATIDKQRSLIDNLKQQNSLLSVGTAVKVLEKEYLDFLMK